MSETLNREAWLELAVQKLRPHFEECKLPIPEKVRVSCGWPSTGGLRARRGECWPSTAAADGVCQIYISPVVKEREKLLGILVHELIHACLPDDAGHKKPFKEASRAVGLEGPVKSNYPGLLLKALLDTLELPDYPHVAIVPVEKEKKQSTRMRKLICKANEEHEEDIILRGSKKVLDLGLPTCFCKNDFELVEETEQS